MSKQDGIIKEFWDMLASYQFVKSTNSFTDEVQEFPLAITDMEATVKINGEFDKHAIEDWLYENLKDNS